MHYQFLFQQTMQMSMHFSFEGERWVKNAGPLSFYAFDGGICFLLFARDAFAVGDESWEGKTKYFISCFFLEYCISCWSQVLRMVAIFVISSTSNSTPRPPVRCLGCCRRRLLLSSTSAVTIQQLQQIRSCLVAKFKISNLSHGNRNFTCMEY